MHAMPRLPMISLLVQPREAGVFRKLSRPCWFSMKRKAEGERQLVFVDCY